MFQPIDFLICLSACPANGQDILELGAENVSGEADRCRRCQSLCRFYCFNSGTASVSIAAIPYHFQVEHSRRISIKNEVCLRRTIGSRYLIENCFHNRARLS